MPQADSHYTPILGRSGVSRRIPANLNELEDPLIDVKGSVSTLVALVDASSVPFEYDVLCWLTHRIEDYVAELYEQYTALLKTQRKPAGAGIN